MSETMAPGAARGVRGFFAAWRLVLRITAANFAGRLQYRGDFLTTLAMGLAWQTSVFVFVAVILTRFPGLGGWPASDILLILAIRMLAHGVVVTVFNSLLLTPYIAQQGLVDFYLVRPMPVYRQVLLYQFPLNALADSFAALALFAVAITRLHLHWTPATVAYLVAAVTGGALLEGAVLMAPCA